MKKKLFLAFLICGLILTTACGKKDGNKNNEPGKNDPSVQEPIINVEAKVIEEQIVENLKITNVSLITQNGDSTFSADVVNMTNEENYVKSINIILKDENGQKVISLLGYLDTTIAPGDSATIATTVTMDLTNVVSVEYVRNY